MASNQKKILSLLAVLSLSVFPLTRWFFIFPLSARFTDVGAVMTSLGQISGLTGLALFAVNLILSARLKIFDRVFNGLDKVYGFHRWVGTISFSLLLFHPLFLAVRYLELSLRSAFLFLLPGADPAITFGSVSLLLMIFFLSLTFYGTLKYQNWKFSHKFMVAAFVFALLHSFLINSDISRDYILRSYLLCLGLIGLAAGFYQAFLSRLINNNFTYTLKNINRLNSKVIDLELQADSRQMQFNSGQFIFVRFLGGKVKSESHPFSLSSAPRGENLSIIIKSLGDFTDTLGDLVVGSKAVLEGPYGQFSYEKADNKKQIWVAGGIGITPFLSMVRDIKSEDYEVDLYYCVNNRDEAVAASELEDMAAKNKKFRLILWCSEEKGRINGRVIMETSGRLENKDIFLCGPNLFMLNLRDQFRKLKVAGSNIHLENFKFL